MGERMRFNNSNNSVEFRTVDTNRFAIGSGGVSGNYGTVQTLSDGGKGGYEGYSINGRYVFMSDDNNTAGIYNDVDNRWILLHERNNYTRLYEPDSGTTRFQIHSNGRVGIGGASGPSQELEVFGEVAANSYCNAGDQTV